MTDKGLLLRGFSRMHDENDIVFEKVVLLHPGTSKETLNYVIQVTREMVEYGEHNTPIVEPKYYGEVILKHPTDASKSVHIEYNVRWTIDELEENIQTLIQSGIFQGFGDMFQKKG